MSAIAAIFFFIIGLVVGSFLNVVILRYNTGRALTGRSQCFSCNHALSWYDLIPLLSFAISRGRCRYCGSALSLQYPLVEILTALLFAAVAFHFLREGADITAGVMMSVHLIVVSLLVVIGVYDIRHTIIPDVPVYLLIAVAFALPFFESGFFHVPATAAFLAGPMAALPIALLWIVSRGRWMGLGDAKLALALGWLLGFGNALAALVLAFWIGAAVSVAYLALSHIMHDMQLFRSKAQLTMKSEIAFGPFLIAAYLIVFFFEFDWWALFIF